MRNSGFNQTESPPQEEQPKPSETQQDPGEATFLQFLFGSLTNNFCEVN